MSDMKSWLLILPRQTMLYFPLGLAYISSALKSHGYRVTCIDSTLLSEDRLSSMMATVIRDDDVGVIGIGGLSRDWNSMRHILDMAAQYNPQIIKVVGGGAISSDPERIIRTLDAHYGVVGEGEETVVELAKAIVDGASVGNIAGLVYRDADGVLRRSAERRGTKDLEAIPYPDFDGFNLNVYLDNQKRNEFGVILSYHDNPRVIPIIFSRSCPFPCTFCFHSIAKYRTRALDSAMEEIRYVIDRYNVNMLSIYDDLFAVKRQRITEFCARIKRFNIPWSCQLRVDVIDEDLLRMMRDAGCYEISLGLESMSQRVLDSMKKKTRVEDVERAIDLIYRANIDIVGNFIFGDFAEDYQSINETMTWWYKHRTYNCIYLYSLNVYPGAEIYHRAVNEGLIEDADEFLRQGCQDRNLTKIPDGEFGFFLDSIKVINYAIRRPAFILDLDARDESHSMSVQAECPHCGSHVRYAGLARKSAPSADTRVICKECCGRFDIPITRFRGRSLPDSVTEATRQAIELIGMGRNGDAVHAAWSACRSGDMDAYHALGVALLREGVTMTVNGKLLTAIDILRQAAFMNPDSADVHNNLGAAYLVGGWLGFGLLHIHHAQDLAPDLVESRHNFAVADSLAREGDLVRFMPMGDAVALEHLRVISPSLSIASNSRPLTLLKRDHWPAGVTPPSWESRASAS
ncbi:MAG: radical SAM protein [Alphaproteobacteria bacterium]